MHRDSFVRIAFIPLLLSACASPLSPERQQARELARREAQWKSLGVHSYDFHYTVIAMFSRPPVSIDVMADTVAHVVALASGQEQPVAGWPTVDSLFAQIHRLQDQHEANLSVTYDAGLGYPTRISGGPNVPDAGYSIVVDHFSAVAADGAR